MVDRPQFSADDDYRIGQYLKIYKRVREQLERREEAAHNLRVGLGNTIVEITPNYANQNIEPGTATGAIMASAAMWVDEYVPVLADVEIAEQQKIDENTMRYQIDVDAPFPQQGRFRALMEAGRGLPSLITDQMDVEDFEVASKSIASDTYSYTVTVSDADVENKEDIGLGLLTDILAGEDQEEILEKGTFTDN